jgi:diguanylate cyclase (GGDEF)-like protein
LDLRVTRLAEQISNARRRTIVASFAIGFIALYAIPSLLLFVNQRPAQILGHLMVLLGAMVFTSIPIFLASCRVPWYPGSERERLRENRGWFLIGMAGATTLVSRGIYAWYDLARINTELVIPLADTVAGASFLLLLAGLLHLPWATGGRRSRSTLLNAAVVLIAMGTLFWPILIGPMMVGDLLETFGPLFVTNYLGMIFILAATMLWIALSDLREELWPTAVAFLLAIGMMILVQAGVLALLITPDGGSSQPFFVLLANAGTTASFLLIGMAGLLRMGSMPRAYERSLNGELVDSSAMIPLWQMLMPYPLLFVLLVVRVMMEIFDWQTEYRSGMVYGVASIVILLMMWQIPMLKFNQELYGRLAQSSIRDGLTGLFTHRALHDLLNAEVQRSRRSGRPLAVLFMDIDHFKSFNDTYGHKAGDGVLQQVAERLSNQVRGGDFVGRYGGEEFMVVAVDLPVEEAFALSERIRSEISSNPLVVDGDHHVLTVSIGVAGLPTHSLVAEELIEYADQAMYLAKQSGRNRTVIFSESANA